MDGMEKEKGSGMAAFFIYVVDGVSPVAPSCRELLAGSAEHRLGIFS
jgi:hypothetical protein